MDFEEEEDTEEQLFARLRYADPRFFAYQLPLNGLIAVLLSKTTTVPLEFLHPHMAFRTIPAHIYFTISNSKGRILFKNHFVKSLFRLCPQYAAQFTIYENFKLFLTSPQGINAWYGPSLQAINGGLAGGVASALVFPINRIYADKLERGVSVFTSIRRNLRHRGIPGLFKGSNFPILKNTIFSGVLFCVYEALIKGWERSEITFSVNFYNACLAGAVGQTVVQPFQIIKISREARDYTYLDTAKRLVIRRGVLQLWHGAFTSSLKASPFIGLTFALYESLKRVNLYDNGYTTTPYREIAKIGVNQEMPAWKLYNLTHGISSENGQSHFLHSPGGFTIIENLSATLWEKIIQIWSPPLG